VTIKERGAAAVAIVEAEAARGFLDELMSSMAGCFRNAKNIIDDRDPIGQIGRAVLVDLAPPRRLRVSTRRSNQPCRATTKPIQTDPPVPTPSTSTSPTIPT
jgi:hypothetical protein